MHQFGHKFHEYVRDICGVFVKINDYMIEKFLYKKISSRYLNAWIFIAAAYVAALGLIYYYNYSFEKELASYAREFNIKGSAEISNKPPKIEFDFRNGTKRVFEGENVVRPVPLQIALISLAQEAGISLQIKSGQIAQVAGVSGNWRVYRNSRKVTAPLDKITIKNGDHYLIKAD